MDRYYLVALVTLVSGLMLLGMGITVARTRRKVNIFPPAMTGDPWLERTIRGHSNTLEWYPVFLPSLWLFAIYGNASWAAALGAVWVIGRVVYFVGYIKETRKRYPGFFIQALATFALLIGALGRVIYLMAA